jgi:integrase
MNATAHKQTTENTKEGQVHELRYASNKIENFLNDKSENTAINYRIDINQFTQFFYGKDLEYILEDELEKIEADDIITYRNWLRGKYANATVNRRINSMKSLFGYLEAGNPLIRKAIFNVAKSLMENPKSWGTLTWEEAQEMAQLANKLPNGHEFSVLIEVAVKTCIRLSALLNLRWEQIYDKDQKGEKIKVIETIDKGQPHLKPISEKVWERIETLKGKEKVFANFHPHKVGGHLDQLCKWMNIEDNRNITFHSFKKTGISYVFDTTNDIMLAQQQANHKSSATTMKSYLEHKKDLREIPSYTMGEEITLQDLESLTKEQLLKAISQMKSSSKLELLRIVKEQ